MDSLFGLSTDGVGHKRTKLQDKEDRIRALPDSIIQHILSLLPSTKEAVQTGVLSKRWQNQWTHVPVLIFKPFHGSDKKYFKFIENTLILHDCSKIKKFHLQYQDDYKRDPRFSSKIRFATSKGVEELILHCYCSDESYLLPKFLFNNASLVRLELINCYFMPNWKVNWVSLKSLKIDCDSLREYSKGIENVVSGSPSLELLELRGLMGDHIAIVSKSLKMLIFVDLGLPTDIKISCPNLVNFRVGDEDWAESSSVPDQMIENILSSSPFLRSLELYSCGWFDQLVITSASLKVLILECNKTNRIEISCPNLEKLYFNTSGEEMLKVMNLPSSVCATIDHIDPWDFDTILVERFLEQLQHIKKLTIESSLLMIVSGLEEEGSQSLPLLNSKCLTLIVPFDFNFALPGIAYALHSPKLETLVINMKFFQKPTCDNLHFISRENYWSTHCPTAFTCLMCRLKAVKLIGLSENADKFTQKLVLNFIEFILENAWVLKKMIVELQNSGTDFVIEVSQKLLSFPRYSRRASVELLCST